jgi:NAD(P)H-nitrite reductase large subunit
MRYLIIGSGAAGISAAESIREVDPAGEILIYSREKAGFYSRPGLAYVLTGEIPESQLFPYSRGYFQSNQFQLIHERVTAIKPDFKQILVSGNRSVQYDRLLLAMGSTAITPKIPGIGLEGVVKLDDIEDARHIQRRMRKTRSAVVVGGGITALEIVEGLVSRKIKTHFLLRKDRYWSGVLDPIESQIVLSRLKHEGVILHFDSEVKAIVGRKNQVESVLTMDGLEIPCELVAIAIGIRPNIEIAQKAGLQSDRGILVDQYLQTSSPDIYAAGDVTQIHNPQTNQSSLNILWAPARIEGRIAGGNMAGRRIAYQERYPMNVTRLAGLTTTIIGSVGGGRDPDEDLLTISRGDSETWRHIPDAVIAQEDFEINRIRLVIGERHILGALIMGDQSLSRYVQRLIADHIDISPIKDRLIQPGADIAGLIARFSQGTKQPHDAHRKQ